MTAVASFGSINVDSVAFLDDAELEALAAGAWLPEPGETRSITAPPPDLEALSFETFTGGKGANQAVAAGKAGADTAFFGKVGPDAAEHGVLDPLRAAGVDISAVAEADAPTGRAYVLVEPDGENRILILAGANGEVDPAYAERVRRRILDADCLLLQNEVPHAAMCALLDAILAAPAEGPTVILDPAPAAGAEALLDHPAIDVVTPNESEARTLGDALAAFEGTIIHTRGGDPIVVEGAEQFTVRPPSVEVVDSTGAGDVFNGVLAARLAAGDPFREAVELAAATASVSATREGAQESIPTLEEVRQVVSGDGRP